MNSPASLTLLHQYASKSTDTATATAHAELMREVGLKCIGFNGVPRTINCLGAFRANLPPDVSAALATTPSRTPMPGNIEAAKERGRKLWESIYRPFEKKLVSKLAHSHPDLPVHILYAEYGLLFADPPRPSSVPGQNVGRLATSLVAVACLRAQTGVGPQVTSHLFGLRKAVEDGSWREGEGEGMEALSEEGVRWLASDEGGVWVLEAVDAIVEAIGEGLGSSFAPLRAKL
jgi:hypothetical protein